MEGRYESTLKCSSFCDIANHFHFFRWLTFGMWSAKASHKDSHSDQASYEDNNGSDYGTNSNYGDTHGLGATRVTKTKTALVPHPGFARHVSNPLNVPGVVVKKSIIIKT